MLVCLLSGENCLKSWIYEGASDHGLCKIRCWKKDKSKKLVFRMNLQENCLRKGFLDHSGRLSWNYLYRTEKNMFLAVKMGNVSLSGKVS